MMPIREELRDYLIHIIEDDEHVRVSLCCLFLAVLAKVEAYCDGRDFLVRYGGRTSPKEIVISDVRMPGIDGVELTERLSSMYRGLPIILITAHGDIGTAVRGMKAGAVDFMEKPFRPNAIVNAVVEAVTRFSDQDDKSTAESAQSLIDQLSRREKQVLTYLMRGMRNKSIAEALGLSHRTVEMHRARMMQKLGAETLPDAIRIGLKSGL